MAFRTKCPLFLPRQPINLDIPQIALIIPSAAHGAYAKLSQEPQSLLEPP